MVSRSRLSATCAPPRMPHAARVWAERNQSRSATQTRETREGNQEKRWMEFHAQPTQLAASRQHQPQDRDPARRQTAKQYGNRDARHEQPERNRIARPPRAKLRK